MLELYDYPLSGNCYKVRLLLAMLGLEHTLTPINFYPDVEHKRPEFLALNPLGQLPLLRDGERLIRDAQAILVHLAVNYAPHSDWYPLHEPARLGEIQQWLAFADSLTATASAARLHDGFFYDINVEAARQGAHKLFRILDEHLWFQEQQGQQWLLHGQNATIADIACFPYVMLSEEGGISRADYPAIRRWGDRIKRLPGFEPMSGIFPAGPGQQACDAGSGEQCVAV